MDDCTGAPAPQIAARCGFCLVELRGKACHICRTPAGHGGEIPPEKRERIDSYCRATFATDWRGFLALVQQTGNLERLARVIASRDGYSCTTPETLRAAWEMLRWLARPDMRSRRAMLRQGLLS